METSISPIDALKNSVAGFGAGILFAVVIFLLAVVFKFEVRGSRSALLMISLGGCCGLGFVYGAYSILRSLFLWKGVVAATIGFAAFVLLGFFGGMFGQKIFL